MMHVFYTLPHPMPYLPQINIPQDWKMRLPSIAKMKGFLNVSEYVRALLRREMEEDWPVYEMSPELEKKLEKDEKAGLHEIDAVLESKKDVDEYFKSLMND